MKKVPLLLKTTFAVCLLVFSTTTLADAKVYKQSISTCRDVIVEQTSNQHAISPSDLRVKLKKIKTRSKAREMKFHIRSVQPNTLERKIVATCKVGRSGKIIALTYDGEQHPVATN